MILKGTKIELENKKSKRKLIIGCLVFMAILVVAIAAVEVARGVSGKNIDTSEGLEIIQQAEQADLSEIEIKIQKLEEKNSAGEEGQQWSLKERFSSTVVLGDTITGGFSECDVLNASSVISGTGTEWEEQMKKLKEVNPKVVFLAYCIDDILESNGNVKSYIKQYRQRIEDVRKAVPNASVFVNSLFAVSSSALEKEEGYGAEEEYNEQLQKMCDKLQIAFVDNSSLSFETYYEEDGIHFKSEFYPVWAERMAEVAAL